MKILHAKQPTSIQTIVTHKNLSNMNCFPIQLKSVCVYNYFTMAWEQQILFEDTQQFTVLVFFILSLKTYAINIVVIFSKVHLVAMVNSLDL
jgi:hypothetical protein